MYLSRNHVWNILLDTAVREAVWGGNKYVHTSATEVGHSELEVATHREIE